MKCARPSAMMFPQVGMSVGRPMPRKDITASTSIAPAQMNVPCTSSGAMVLGRIWRSISFHAGVSSAMAAST
ncbi:hypothetical protein D3C72_1862990 [compost metagenome]